jgi:hypothetical protein
MDWVWVGTSVATVTTGVSRCVAVKIRAESHRRALEILFRDADPEDRVKLLLAMGSRAKSE